MICNASLKEMAAVLKAAQTILIFPHTGPDGDAIGSAAALCRGLRNAGKEAWILMEEEVPEYIRFIDTEFCTLDEDIISEPDICICVDCSEESRFPKLADKYRQGKKRLCIDHHATVGAFGDYYYIDETEAAAAQLIYKLLLEMDIEIDRSIAESLYVAISSDTGSFQYSNTTAETHSIAAALFDVGIDHNNITVKLYQNISLKKVRLQSAILSRMELLAGGKAAVSYTTEEMLRKYDSVIDDAEGSIDMLRNIEGVEIAVFLKEKDGAVKVSMRAKSYGDVGSIAVKFGGGGHTKAAGCTLKMGMDEALEVMKTEIKEYLNNK